MKEGDGTVLLMWDVSSRCGIDRLAEIDGAPLRCRVLDPEEASDLFSFALPESLVFDEVGLCAMKLSLSVDEALRMVTADLPQEDTCVCQERVMH